MFLEMGVDFVSKRDVAVHGQEFFLIMWRFVCGELLVLDGREGMPDVTL